MAGAGIDVVVGEFPFHFFRAQVVEVSEACCLEQVCLQGGHLLERMAFEPEPCKDFLHDFFSEGRGFSLVLHIADQFFGIAAVYFREGLFVIRLRECEQPVVGARMPGG